MTGVWLLALGALLADQEVRLRYQRGGAEACPDTAELSALVTAALGYDPFRDDAARTIEARITPAGRGLEARIRILREGEIQGERTLSSPDRRCEELARAVALAISVAIDPLAFRRRPPVETATAAAPPPPQRPLPPVEPDPEPDAADPVEPPVEPVEARRIEVAVGGGILGAAGTAPAITAGAWTEARIGWPLFTLGFELRADLPARLSLPGRSGVSVLLAAGFVVPCIRVAWFSACAVGGAGLLRASGEDLQDGRSVSSAYGGLGARAAASILILERIELLFRAELLASLARTTLVVSDQDVWTSPRVAGSLGAGIAVRFP